MLKRTSLIVYFRSPKAIKQIDRIANVAYFHKKRKYAVCYVSEGSVEETTNKLNELKLVKRVDESLIENDGYHIDFDVK